MKRAVSIFFCLLTISGLAFSANPIVDPAVAAPAKALASALSELKPFPTELFTSNAIVVDEFPPFTWQGPDAARNWYEQYLGLVKSVGMRDIVVIVSDPDRNVTIAADRAYVTFPTSIKYTLKGKREEERGRWTLVLEKQSGKWRIASHSWDRTYDSTNSM
jgi:ketosteroid isomerase-like protein